MGGEASTRSLTVAAPSNFWQAVKYVDYGVIGDIGGGEVFWL
jgi:hypothetical protein